MADHDLVGPSARINLAKAAPTSAARDSSISSPPSHARRTP
ncbi:hypothetical protein I553_4027 [Mycobacterium xenopi 4042]|uniref:Uncharacterized protein n=1 Tax=Mycobacterium xenopi 4042 TaxID=1299334 RepID=X8DDB7_MYCXE|nr:hypothetical protein I552_9182 [Mycobacterium xenopi 3993]EUA66071.1 hypothetical protein I553_4027 [Mycobacterium xenopi 4042]